MGEKLAGAHLSHSPLQMAVKYARYYFSASSGKGHGIHSPFVFDFVQNVLNDSTHYNEYAQVERLRKRMLRASALVAVEDLGAGASRPARAVSDIAAMAAKSPRLGQLLFRLARYYQPSGIIELGTSLGISAAYLALACPGAPAVTGEGNRAIAAIAEENFTDLNITSLRMAVGNFDDTLEDMIAMVPQPSMVFIDGNHRQEPTVRYFQRLLRCMTSSSMIVFDDIHWSAEMESAWKIIKDDPAVMMTIDLFFMGLVFFRPEFKVKQHFTIRY